MSLICFLFPRCALLNAYFCLEMTRYPYPLQIGVIKCRTSEWGTSKSWTLHVICWHNTYRTDVNMSYNELHRDSSRCFTVMALQFSRLSRKICPEIRKFLDSFTSFVTKYTFYPLKWSFPNISTKHGKSITFTGITLVIIYGNIPCPNSRLLKTVSCMGNLYMLL